MWRWLLRAAVSAAVVAVLLSVVPLDAVLQAIKRIRISIWMASLAVFFAGHYLNAVKLRLLLGSEFAPLSACVRAQYAGLVANLSLPGLAGGDLVRAAYLAPTAGTKRVTIASIADRLLDTATLLVLVGVALPFAGVPPAIADVLTRAGWWLTAIAIASTVALVIVLMFSRFSAAVSNRLGQAWHEVRRRRLAFVGATMISLSVQAAFVMTNVWLARQVGVTTAVSAWFVAWPISKLIAVLPISLGGIGVREAALVSLTAPYGAPREAVLASGILWQAVLIVSGLLGLVVTQVIWRPTQTGVRENSKVNA